ncbi:MAG: hypothetical protein RLZZ200_2049 [Pseudomonadota bacterium]
MRPKVDYNRCEGKAACVAVCPTKVFDLRVLAPEERGPLTLAGRLRRFLHGGPQAAVTRPDQCSGCGRCVTACPESAIRLED